MKSGWFLLGSLALGACGGDETKSPTTGATAATGAAQGGSGPSTGGGAAGGSGPGGTGGAATGGTGPGGAGGASGGRGGAGGCKSDAECAFGKEWCDKGACVACDNSGLACKILCPFEWKLYVRNGCTPCACAPENQCEKDEECKQFFGNHCYAGNFCWDWCPPGDPTCCYGNTCGNAGCTPPSPVGCKKTGCPLGLTCTEGGCAPSGCACAGGGQWACTDDCGGGTCVQ
jgi:hypothetical protein